MKWFFCFLSTNVRLKYVFEFVCFFRKDRINMMKDQFYDIICMLDLHPKSKFTDIFPHIIDEVIYYIMIFYAMHFDKLYLCWIMWSFLFSLAVFALHAQDWKPLTPWSLDQKPSWYAIMAQPGDGDSCGGSSAFPNFWRMKTYCRLLQSLSIFSNII